ncbi:MAG: Transport ATP-binding protein CydD [uncultured Thiotrichaceae bacterium]|uniref:Transport ATP-binding protein CydD n=1 Tax=uncultured Thiotrichaceae bacterium TaxID=298394 RepID=A0A6S6SM78_9GAMM|nr:MAG: Transport ATP-binding protein CydD [uncultured Thiotrichaceae bacterium]
MATIDFLKSLKKYVKRDLNLAVAVGLLSGFLIIAQAWLLTNALTGVVFNKQQLSDVMPWLWGILAIFSVRAVLSWLSEQIAFRAATKIKQDIRMRLHEHLQLLGPDYLIGQRSGELANTIVDGVDALENYYARYLPTMSLVALLPLAILVFIFPIDWISGLVLLVTAPLIPFFMILIGKGAEKLNQKQWRKLARMSAHFLDMIQGLTTLKLFNASRREAKVIARVSEEYRQSTMAVLRVAFLSSLILEFLATVSIAIVAVLIGFRLLYGEIDYLYGFFILLLAPEFYLPLRNMGTHYHARMEAIGAAEKIIEVLETPVPENRQAAEQAIFKSYDIQIAMQGLVHSYNGNKNALDHLDIEIPAGKTVALVGTSGAGKSTVAKLLLGFLELQQGTIRINDRDFKAINLEQWREHLAWVPQTPHLFQGSVFENIALGKPTASLAEVEKAARLANIHDFIMSLPEKYQTELGENAKNLSGGQRQRLALARAFLKNAPFVILDEATAHLDKESEALIQQSIDVLSKNRTVLIIAHRINTIENADQIILMQDGKALEQGTHQELLSMQHYARLYEQFREGNE